jgi:ATP-dependent Clp protease ATP-binding subunit ClpX
MKTLPLEWADSLTPERIYKELDRYVIGQRKAKRTVSIAAYNHIKRLHNRETRHSGLIKKSNILMIGPTGCGKTHIARNLARILQLPFTIVDATEYTEAGYYGKDVEVMVGELLHKCGGAVEETQRGIIFIDEIDKIARRSHGARTGAGSRDIGGEGVQQALLKLLEGAEMFIPLNVTQHWNRHDFVQVDTSEILFICAGTFSDLKRDLEKGNMGFVRKVGKGKTRSIETEHLVQYGMIPELLGRLPVVVELEELEDDQMIQVLKDPPDSLVKEYQALLAMDHIHLQFKQDGFEEIIRVAKQRKLGARGLRAIMEELMHDLMFDAPKKRGKKVIVNGKFVQAKLNRHE